MPKFIINAGLSFDAASLEEACEKVIAHFQYIQTQDEEAPLGALLPPSAGFVNMDRVQEPEQPQAGA